MFAAESVDSLNDAQSLSILFYKNRILNLHAIQEVCKSITYTMTSSS